MYTSIGFLLFAGAIGVLIPDANGAAGLFSPDLSQLNDQYKSAKKSVTSLVHGMLDVNVNELPNLVFFDLYTRETRNNPEKLYVGDLDSVNNSHFDQKKPTKFVTHGWMSNCQEEVCTEIRDAFLQNSDCNVILVDWRSISMNEYIWVSNQVLEVAQFVASMIDFLHSQGMDLTNTTVVGHSLGAHVAGLASFYAKEQVFYIVALDPAGPNFSESGPDERVSSEDAAYVLVIHTSSELGIGSPIGHADFYPNGGKSQVGCVVDLEGLCSHIRSHEYFAESINSDRFVAVKCDNYYDFKNGKCNSNPTAVMGGAVPNFDVQGSYYLDTNPQPPYAMH